MGRTCRAARSRQALGGYALIVPFARLAHNGTQVMQASNMKKIPLTGKYGRGTYALVDDEDYNALASKPWFATKQGYALHVEYLGGGRAAPKRRPVYMHNLILPPPPGYVVDHKNGNKRDNQRSNLRIGTQADNNHNVPIERKNQSHTGYKCVYKVLRSTRFWAKIGFQGRFIYLGTFDTAEEAAQAYNDAAIKYHGEFASFNRIPSDAA